MAEDDDSQWQATPADDPVGHVPVLARQVLDTLAPQPGHLALDCTLGRGGHAELLARAIGPSGRLIGLDVDPANVEFSRQRLAPLGVPLHLTQANFASAGQILRAVSPGGVDLLLADLGFASNQMSDPARGFSFMNDGPLDMRLDPRIPKTAADLLRDLSEREIADLLYRLGDEPRARQVARKIVENRSTLPIATTKGLAQIVREVYGVPAVGERRKIGRTDPATRTFMAMRIAVNGELVALDSLLRQLPTFLRPGGTAAIISFHSLEDRRIKQTFAQLAGTGAWQVLTPHPLTADEAEQHVNPRSRSAKLRAIRRS